jgi:hypothetical protein
MVEATFTFGFIIAAGMAFLLWQAPTRLRRFVLRHDFTFGLIVSIIVLWIHWGTMTGLMSATVAGFIWGIMTWTWRKFERIA